MKLHPAVLMVALLLGCNRLQPVNYVPNLQVADPPGTVIRIIQATVASSCLARPEINDDLLQVEQVCGRSTMTKRVRRGRVQQISVQHYGDPYNDFYVVTVSHLDGTPPFEWSCPALEDATALADAISAWAR